MKMGNLDRGSFNTSKIEFIPSEEHIEEQHKLRYGDVLFNTRNTLELVGKVAIWRNELPIAYYNSNLMRLEFNRDNVVSNEYANYALNTEGSIERLGALATGTTSVAAIYTRDLLGLPFIVPPPAEQRAIATALSDADALIKSLYRLIAKKRAIKQAAMQQLLTGQTRLARFTGEWQTKRLGEFVSIRDEKVMPSAVHPETACIELEHIGKGDGRLVTHSMAKYSTSSKYQFRAGDVLFGRLRSYLRKYWLAKHGGICTTEIWPLVIDANKAVSGFLLGIVQSKRFTGAASVSYGTHMPRADWKVLENFEVKLPKIEEQAAIATVLSNMDTEIGALERRREKARQIKQGMMQQLLTGRVRLVEENREDASYG